MSAANPVGDSGPGHSGQSQSPGLPDSGAAKKPVRSVADAPLNAVTASSTDLEPPLNKDAVSRLREFFELLDSWDQEHRSRLSQGKEGNNK